MIQNPPRTYLCRSEVSLAPALYTGISPTAWRQAAALFAPVEDIDERMANADDTDYFARCIELFMETLR